MPSSAAAILRYLGRLGLPSAPVQAADDALLQRFVQHKDEAAFADLLARHGPLVWRVCRLVLNDVHAAADAYQATFLILASRAASIRRADSLAGWLHQTALRAALKARAAMQIRHVRETPVIADAQPDRRPDPKRRWRGCFRGRRSMPRKQRAVYGAPAESLEYTAGKRFRMPYLGGF